MYHSSGFEFIDAFLDFGVHLDGGVLQPTKALPQTLPRRLPLLRVTLPACQFLVRGQTLSPFVSPPNSANISFATKPRQITKHDQTSSNTLLSAEPVSCPFATLV